VVRGKETCGLGLMADGAGDLASRPYDFYRRMAVLGSGATAAILPIHQRDRTEDGSIRPIDPADRQTISLKCSRQKGAIP
jgi:hypothetical protein